MCPQITRILKTEMLPPGTSRLSGVFLFLYTRLKGADEAMLPPEWPHRPATSGW